MSASDKPRRLEKIRRLEVFITGARNMTCWKCNRIIVADYGLRFLCGTFGRKELVNDIGEPASQHAVRLFECLEAEKLARASDREKSK